MYPDSIYVALMSIIIKALQHGLTLIMSKGLYKNIFI